MALVMLFDLHGRASDVLKQKRFVARQGSSVMEPASGTLIDIAPDERSFSIVVVSVWKNGRQRGYLDGPWAA
jgi:hypothetical protein